MNDITDLRQAWLEASRGTDKAALEVSRAGGALEGETLYEACARLLKAAHPDKPDIRPASELTAERLGAWEWWALACDDGGWATLRAVDFQAWWRVFGGEAVGVACYPIRSGNPWEFASWDEVDERVKEKA